MYDEKLQKQSIFRNSDIVDELGQVSFLFCDKTGTITKNQLYLRKISIANEEFHLQSDSIQFATAKELLSQQISYEN